MSNRQMYFKAIVEFVLFLLALGCMLTVLAVIITPVPPPVSRMSQVDKSELVRLAPQAMAEQARIYNYRMEQQARTGK